jgi:hypothetical protein
MYLPILFNGEALSQLRVYPTLGIDWQLMGAKEIKADIELPGALNCPIGSYISYKGEKFTVNTVPGVTAGNTYDFKYTITFESELYRLYDKKLKHLKNKTFQYYGSPADYAQLIVDNINEIDTGWSVGDCESATEKTINFDGHTCRTALDTIAEAFSFEWDVVGKVISFVKQVGNTTTHEFERGRGKGLYSLGYEYQNDKNIVTRAFGYGSTRNLPANYRGGATQLMFGEEYLDNNTSLYRIKEGDYVNEDIYPKVDGLVTGVSAFNADADFFTISDNTLNFNLKDCFSTDTPKISFLTGELQGQEFEILDFENSTKTIKVKVFTDGSNNKQPNSVFQAAIGDTYTLFDMFLPAERVAAAEALLKAKTQEWLLENSVPRVLYSLEIDPLYARDNGIMLKPGDKVRVVDAQLGIDSMVRVTGVSYPINFPEVITPDTKINVQIANFIPYTTTERVISDTIDTKQEVKYVNRINAERARRNSANLRTLQSLIFNPDGTLFDGPNSIVAGMAAFGFDSQNLNLDNVTINPNAGGDSNSLSITAGRLVHYFYKIDGLGCIWDMAGRSWSGLDPAKNYYLYAKCSNGVLTGIWELSETPVMVNDIPGYYAFNLGILYKVNNDGYRVLQSTKGVTTIVGDQITTGTISSIDSATSFNLNTGVIKGRIQFENGSSGYNNLSDKPDLSNITGRNLVRHSQLNNLAGWNGNGGNAEIENGVFKITSNNAGNGVYSGSALTVPIKENTDYAISFEIKAIYLEQNILNVGIENTPSAITVPNDDIHWNKVAYTMNTGDYSGSGTVIIYGAGLNQRFYIRNLKIERGTVATDWSLAPEDTSQDIANAQATADAAQDAADSAIATSQLANEQLAAIADDNILAASEKAEVLKDWETIQGEKPTIDAQLTTYSVPTASYDSAYNDLSAYIEPLLVNLSENSPIDGPAFRSKFVTYYNAKVSGLKAVADAAKVIADNAQADATTALANSQNALETAARAALVTDGLVTIIDGNLVATGTLLVGDATHINGGITGVTDQGDDSIRNWNGADFANRYSAKYRVTEAGKLYASDAEISGKITAESGMIGNFTIDGEGLVNTQNIDAHIIQQRNLPNGGIVKAAIGTNINEDGFIGDFKNNVPNPNGPNAGVKISVTGGTWKSPMLLGLTGNQALDIEGDTLLSNGAFAIDGNFGVTQNIQYNRGDDKYTMRFYKGIYIGNFPGW